MTHLARRPHTVVVLAMSADGKITDYERTAARFSSSGDRAHLERQIALADGVLFGAETLRAYGTTLRVSQPELLSQRQQQGKPPQPVQMVASRSAAIDPSYRFFQQPVPHWLITTAQGADLWQQQVGFERILVAETPNQTIDWFAAFTELSALGIQRLAILGGGTLVESLLAVDLIDELWLTVCPLLLGGAETPTPVEGTGFSVSHAPRLELLSVDVINQEVFLHYRLRQQHPQGEQERVQATQ